MFFIIFNGKQAFLAAYRSVDGNIISIDSSFRTLVDDHTANKFNTTTLWPEESVLRKFTYLIPISDLPSYPRSFSLFLPIQAV